MATTSVNTAKTAESGFKAYVMESTPETHYGKIYGSSVLTVAGVQLLLLV